METLEQRLNWYMEILNEVGGAENARDIEAIERLKAWLRVDKAAYPQPTFEKR